MLALEPQIARPGAADYSTWSLELTPEPQIARPWNRTLLELAVRARPGAAEYAKMVARACPDAVE